MSLSDPIADMLTRIRNGVRAGKESVNVKASNVCEGISGVLKEEGSVVRLPSHQIELTKPQQEKVDKFLGALKSNPYSPPGDITVEPDLLNLLIEQQKVVKVADGIVFSRETYDEMVDKIVARAREQGKITLAEVRDMFSTSRKYAMALLEYMDARKITRRVGDDRVVR